MSVQLRPAWPGKAVDGAGWSGSTNIEGVEHRFINRELTWLALQRAGPAVGRANGDPAARTGQVLRHHDDQPRRVLPGRVAALKDQVAAGSRSRHPTGCTPVQQLGEINERAAGSSPARTIVSSTELVPRCAEAGLASSAGPTSTTPTWRLAMYEQRIFPVLTPLAVDPSHPFPYISNLALSSPRWSPIRQARIALCPRQGADVFPRLVDVVDSRFLPVETSSSPSSTTCSPAW